MFPQRKRQAEVEGIRLSYVCPAIPAGSSLIVDWEKEGKFAKYVPYQTITVFNNSTAAIDVYINQDSDKVYPVAGKMERSIDKINCWNLRIDNSTATDIASGEIVLMAETESGTADALAKKILRWWVR